MTARAFSKVYHDIRSDRRFAEVYRDDNAFALWVRLLIAANESWPDPGPIPRSTKPGALALLVESRLIVLVGRDEFRVHGLDRERKTRRLAAVKANQVRWGRNGSGEESEPESEPESGPESDRSRM